MFKLSDLWQALLSACIRFLDNRFQPKENEALYVAKIELERTHSLVRLMTDKLSNQSLNEVKAEPEQELPKPIGTPNWRVKARQLEKESRRRAELIREAKESTSPIAQEINNLEKEVGIS